MKSMRQSTLETVGLGSVLGIFQNGRMPVNLDEMVDKVFGPAGDRGALLISGGNGIVGSGKAMQFGSRLAAYGVPIVTLDLPDAPDGIGKQYKGLKRSFGAKATDIMSNVIRFNYGGGSLPEGVSRYKPKFVLEAIPEILPLKRAHYDLMRETFPGVEIRSVTSGFPARELGVGVTHPSFPHEINKVWEIVEDSPSDITKLLHAMGLIPITVGDQWSFILDVLFCGITLAATRYHEATNMPYWKLDKYVRRLVGPNPVRAHDAIGPGASFLTWSCLHHLTEMYGDVFKPTQELIRRKESGESWYSSNRPVVDWDMPDDDEFQSWILGPIFQMTSLMLHEQRAHLSHMNAIGELCAQFSKGVNALMRGYGADAIVQRVEAYHKLHPEAAGAAWYPDVFSDMGSPEWQMLYVNAEHDGNVGVVTISRESLNWDVVNELGHAVDWLKSEGIQKVILTGDFHLSTQLVGADTTEFFAGLENEDVGFDIASSWSKVARRFNDEFDVSVGFINGKRCLGGMLELMMHCHYLVSVDGAQVGMPEVTLPVVPGMEGCHWALRKAKAEDYQKVLKLLLVGQSVPASEATGWLVDYAGGLEDSLQKAWAIATGSDHGIAARRVEENPISVPTDLAGFVESTSPAGDDARKAIMDCVQASCSTTLSEALDVQARHSAGFMTSKACQKGAIGSAATKTLKI